MYRVDLGSADITEPSQFYEQYHGSVQNKRITPPKKLDYWVYVELTANLRDEVRYLREEINKKDEIIARYTTPVFSSRENVSSESKEPVRRYVSPGKILAQMEDIERRKYWEGEIKRRENLVKQTGNVSDVGTLGVRDEKETTGTTTN